MVFVGSLKKYQSNSNTCSPTEGAVPRARARLHGGLRRRNEVERTKAPFGPRLF